MDFRTDVTLGLKNPLMPPLMNGGGCVKTIEDVRTLVPSLVGAVVGGSYTVLPQTGNEGQTFWPTPHATFNSLGMPNPGIPYIKANMREMVMMCHDAGKFFVANVAGYNPAEYAQLTEICFECGVDGVEENFGCPNILTGGVGKRKPIVSLNSQMFEETLHVISRTVGEKTVWIKVSPNSNADQIRDLASIVSRYRMVKAITAINTVPNTLVVDEAGESIITVGLAGLSGPPLKPIGLGQVFLWRKALLKTIEVIGVGGISSGSDIRDYFKWGATACQVTTELLKGNKLNPNVLGRIVIEFDAL